MAATVFAVMSIPVVLLVSLEIPTFDGAPAGSSASEALSLLPMVAPSAAMAGFLSGAGFVHATLLRSIFQGVVTMLGAQVIFSLIAVAVFSIRRTYSGAYSTSDLQGTIPTIVILTAGGWFFASLYQAICGAISGGILWSLFRKMFPRAP